MTQLMIGSSQITYVDAGATRSIPFRSGESVTFPAAAPFDGTCEAVIWADDAILYQDVIWVMDALLERGVVDVYLGEPTQPPTRGAARKTPTKEKLRTAPILTIARTDVTFQGAMICNAENPWLAVLVAAKLPPRPADPLIILQADRGHRFGAVKLALKGMTAAGYTNVLFATKSSKP